MARIVFTLNQDPKQTVRLRRYFAAAGTSLLAIGLLFACEAHGVISQGIDAVILTILTREISLLAGSTREA